METTGNSFTGSYTYTLDSKGRVNIPAKMRKALDAANDRTFVATRGDDPCVILYPAVLWKRVEEELLGLNRGRALNRHYIRNIVRHAEALQYDGQGRVALPAPLIEFAAIDSDVEIVGMINRIEIWDPKTLSEYEGQFTDLKADLEAIASEISL